MKTTHHWRGLAIFAGLTVATVAHGGDNAPQPCHPAGMETAALCGSIERPLNPADAASPRIRVHYAVIPAMARQKQPDPLYFLAGGPGQGAIELMSHTLGLLGRVNHRRDLVFVDQRGTGQSAPLLCDDDARLPLAESIDPQRQIARLAACRAKLEKLPYGDLRRYTTTLAMQDLDAVRAALGHTRINLIGASYGTRAALEYLRLYPERVRRVVLDGVAPPDMALPFALAADADAALRRHFELCEKDPGCARRHPRLRQQWHDLLASLPRTVVVDHPVTGARETLSLTRDMLLGLVRVPLYQPWVAAALPPAIAAASEGRWNALFGLASTSAPGRMKIATGMHYSVVCAEDMAPSRRPVTVSGDFAGVGAATYERVCADWPRGQVDEAFYRIAASPAPVLVFSGGLDPVTPPRHGERVVKALGEKARHVVAPNAGHGALGSLCANGVLKDFFGAATDAAALQVETGCLQRAPAPQVFVPLAELMGVAK